MKVLEVNEKYLLFCGAFLKDENPKTTRKLLQFVTNFIFVVGSLYSLALCSAMYIYHHPNDISGATNACITLFAGLSTFGAYAGVVANQQNVKHLHRKLQSIVDDGKLIIT